MKELIEQLEQYEFNCEAGLLENCVEWIKLKKLTKAKNDLLEKIKWHFECADAMLTVYSLLLSSKRKQTKRYHAYLRLTAMAEEAENDLRELL